MPYEHIPVMIQEVLAALGLKKGGTYIDCTLGGAGYTRRISLAAGNSGKVLSIDADELALANATEIIKRDSLDNIVLVHDNFRNLSKISAEYLPQGADGIVFDLGLSSAQLEDESRGFSFQGDRPLDMAFGEGEARTTASILSFSSLSELTRIFREYGEEPKAYQLAKAIIAARREKPFRSTKDLVDVVEKTIKRRPGGIHPATKAFQALRMATNDEFQALEEALAAVPLILKKGGRVAIVSFHSGEDRIVKQWLKRESTGCICPPQAPVCVCGHEAIMKPLTKKPLIPSEEEIADNSRARSAKLRAAEKIG
ncbi:MAG: 16S rRNA (cytosine(1402)-N(4))-methyltransferase RsmH [Bacillota bacterium]